MSSDDVTPEIQLMMKRHPLLFRGEPPLAHSYVPVGWITLVDELFHDIARIAGDRIQCVTVRQVKQKLGMLRAYTHVQPDRAPDDVGTFGGPQSALLTERNSATDLPSSSHQESMSRLDGLRDQIRARVSIAMEQSRTTCEWCGALGRVVAGSGLISVACEEHTPPGASPFDQML